MRTTTKTDDDNSDFTQCLNKHFLCKYESKEFLRNNRFINKAFLVFHGAFIVFCCILATSCQQFDDEAEELIEANAVTLKVMTRSADETPIQYPVYMFAFEVDGKYAGSQIVQSEEENISFSLPKGEYRLVALSGISDDYVIPENPTAEDVITFTNGKYANNPLMQGMADVTLTGKNTKATVVLSYIVAAVQVRLNNIPNATSVQISIAPLFPSFSFIGDYEGDGQKITLTCQKEEEDSWTHDIIYIFPGASNKTTFSITIEEEGEVQTFGYTYTGSPEANHPFNIVGNYDETLSLEGFLEANGWEEPINVNFSFGNGEEEQSTPDEPNGEDEEEPSTNNETPTNISEDIPKVGDIWNDCIVVDVTNIKNTGADLLLLSLEEWQGLPKECKGTYNGYSVNGIGNWRMPTDIEAKKINEKFIEDNLKALNTKIRKRQYNEVLISSTERYLCLKGNTYYSFMFAKGKRVTKAGPQTIYLIRPVVKYHFTINNS